MLRLVLLRHSFTEGNLQKRYVGVTDEPLCPQGIRFLEEHFYPETEHIFVSPMLRCVQTARLIYPKQPFHIIEELAECDFGDFENKNYLELSDNPDYQKWVDSGGILPFPNGESRETFRWRSLKGFERAVYFCLNKKAKSATIVTHGGNIMSILEEYASSPKSYYQWHVENGCGYVVELEEDLWKQNREELYVMAKIPHIHSVSIDKKNRTW